MKRSAIGPIVMALAIATVSITVHGQDAGSKAFINDLTIAGLAEVQLGKLAADHAMSPDVKAFGQMMVKDDTQAANELKPIAMKLNVQQPAAADHSAAAGHGDALTQWAAKVMPTVQMHLDRAREIQKKAAE